MKTMAENLLSSMSFVGEDLIHEAEIPVKRNRFLPVAGALIASALLLVFLTLPQQDTDPGPTIPIDPFDRPSELRINWAEAESDQPQGVFRLDMDVETLVHLIPDEETKLQWSWLEPGIRGLDQETAKQLREEKAAWEVLMAEFSAEAGTDGEALLEALGTEFEIEDFYTRRVRKERDGPYELIHDYCLDLKTESGGRAIVSLSDLAAPLRCYLIHDDGPLVSRIGDTELVINGCELNDGTLYLTRFTRGGESDEATRGCTWYDVETEDFSIDELERLLEILLHDHTA